MGVDKKSSDFSKIFSKNRQKTYCFCLNKFEWDDQRIHEIREKGLGTVYEFGALLRLA